MKDRSLAVKLNTVSTKLDCPTLKRSITVILANWPSKCKGSMLSIEGGGRCSYTKYNMNIFKMFILMYLGNEQKPLLRLVTLLYIDPFRYEKTLKCHKQYLV